MKKQAEIQEGEKAQNNNKQKVTHLLVNLLN